MAESGATRFLGNSSIYAFGNILRQMVGFIMLPIYTRHMEPADYGVIGLLTFSLSLIEIIFGARLLQVMPKLYHEKNDENHRKTVISTAFIQTSIISALTLATLLAFHGPTSLLIFRSTGYELIFAIFSITLLTQAVETYALLYLRLQSKAWTFLIINTCKLALQVSLNIWLVVYEDMGALGVAISNVAASMLFACILGAMTLKNTGIKYSKSIANRMLQLSWPLWLAAIAGIYIGSGNIYYLNIFSSLSDIGLFELAGRLSSVIGVLVWQPLLMYWQTERFKYYAPNKPAPVIHQTVFWFMATLVSIAAMGVSIFATPVIEIMAAEEYHGAAKAAPYLALGAMMGCLSTYFNFSFIVKEKTSLITKSSYLTAIIATVFFLTLIPRLGYLGAAIATALIQLTQFLISYHWAKKEYDMGIKPPALAALIAIFAAGSTASNLLGIATNIWIDLTQRVLVFLAAGIAMIGVLYLNKECRFHVNQLLRSSVGVIMKKAGKR